MTTITRIKAALIMSVMLAGLMVLARSTPAAEQESIVLDPSTGNYVITYYSDASPPFLETVTWVPATKVVPTVRSRFRRTDEGLISYRYTIHNGRKSRQHIANVGMTVSSIEAGSQEIPPEWYGVFAPNFNPHINGGNGYNGGWLYTGKTPLGGIAPGRSLNGFGLASPDLPGAGIMKVAGATPPDQSFPDSGPDPSTSVGMQFNELNDHNYVPRYIAVPWIPVPTPFNAATVLTSLQKHVDQDLVSMKLIDPSLVATLDPLFQSAITAAQGGNNEALRSDLRALRRSLSNERGQEEKAEHAEEAGEVEDDGERAEVGPRQPIAKLARDVLEFDLKYLERQVKPGKHDAGG